jgi:hypothetical protein
VRRPLSGVLDARLDETADLIEQEAHVECTEVQRHTALVKA